MCKCYILTVQCHHSLAFRQKQPVTSMWSTGINCRTVGQFSLAEFQTHFVRTLQAKRNGKRRKNIIKLLLECLIMKSGGMKAFSELRKCKKNQQICSCFLSYWATSLDGYWVAKRAYPKLLMKTYVSYSVQNFLKYNRIKYMWFHK